MRDCCENCPMYWNSEDYWDEYDEGGYCNLEGLFTGEHYIWICYMPNFILKIFFKYWSWKEKRLWKKK